MSEENHGEKQRKTIVDRAAEIQEALRPLGYEVADFSPAYKGIKTTLIISEADGLPAGKTVGN